MDQVDEEHIRAVFIDLLDNLEEDQKEPVRSYIREQLGREALEEIDEG